MGERKKYVVAMVEENNGKRVPGKELGDYRLIKTARKVIPILAKREGLSYIERWKIGIFMDGNLVK